MKQPDFTYSYSLLNNLATMVGMFQFIHSEQVQQSFNEMANLDFELDFAEIKKEEAETLNNLLKISDSLIFISKMQSNADLLLPNEIILGIKNINQKLKPFEEYINGIATGTMTNAEAEHKLLAWGCQKLNDDYFLEIADTL